MLKHPALTNDPATALVISWCHVYIVRDARLTVKRESFVRTDLEFLQAVKEGGLSHSGTTVMAAAVLEMRLFVAHVGDCRAILCRNGRAMDLSTDHRPTTPSERQRIESAGGYIDSEGYLNGELQVSRAIGDFQYTKLKNEDGSGFLIAEPDLLEQKIETSDEFVVLTSDGALDVMTPGQIIRIARKSLVEHNAPETAAEAVVTPFALICPHTCMM